ncbi:MAG: N-succinylarginine dihydrolase [Tatlockia sp.]|nr:N-succinylarginine dihydrolase [Tatlockia sp.]
MKFYELNLDGLVGSTHHYAGLSLGNLASTSNKLLPSNPQAAALQGLAKMRMLVQLGLKQAIMPPHQRPNLELLFQLGFKGTARQQVEKAAREAPEILGACYSSSFMWTANAATVSSSLDTADRRVHFTAANLISNLHRHQEANFAKLLLERLFSNETYFHHHSILPNCLISSDEGAANHSRLCVSHGNPGINLFVYGKQSFNFQGSIPLKFPARQTLEASQAIARTHQLDLENTVIACQNPRAIDQGVFHNDVIAVANEQVLLIHEEAFSEQSKVLAGLQKKAPFPIQIIEIPSKRLDLPTSVGSYFFNSQLVSIPNKADMALMAPTECKESPIVSQLIEELLSDKGNPISMVHYLDLKQSMRNGGGPACLRLRIPLSEQEFNAMHQAVIVSESLLDKLEIWVRYHYRTQLEVKDLADPKLLDESFQALDELSQILELGAIYPFQLEITT